MPYFVFCETSFLIEVPAQRYDQQETSQEILQNRKSQWKKILVIAFLKIAVLFLIKVLICKAVGILKPIFKPVA